MGISRQRPFTDLVQQVCNAEVITQGDAQGQGIDEKSHQPFQFFVRTIGDRGANNHLLLTTQPGEDNTPGGQYNHKQRRVMALSNRFK